MNKYPPIPFPSDESNEDKYKGLAEIGVAGTITGLATQISAAGIGQVVVGTFGASAITVSLPAVVAIGASGVIGISLGKKIVKMISD